MAHLTPAENLWSLESEDALTAGALGFMPRILVLTTLPHRRPASHRLERINGRHTLRLSAPRTVGLPYGSYPRLLLAYLTTEAVRSKNPEIDLGASANELARRLGLSVISGPRGTAARLENQLHRLTCMRLEWKASLGIHPLPSGSGSMTVGGSWWSAVLRQMLPRQPTWRPRVVLGQEFFDETRRSAIPVDLRAAHHLRRSPLAIDLYVWLTYRMSYLRKPTHIPWAALQSQFGAAYSRPRDFRRRALAHLEDVVRVYSRVRVSQTDTGLRLYPSPPHVQALP